MEQRLLALARTRAFADGALIANGDTVHPPSVERPCSLSRGADVLLAVDDEKTLGEEEMKVLGRRRSDAADRQGRRPGEAAGEYIGVALVEAAAATAAR